MLSNRLRPLSLVVAVALLLFAIAGVPDSDTPTASASPAPTLGWIQWTNPGAYPSVSARPGSQLNYNFAPSAVGALVLPNGSTVYVAFEGEVVGSDNASGFGDAANYWTTGGRVSSHFISTNVPTNPTNGDRIGVSGNAPGGGVAQQTLRFYSDAARTTPTEVSNIVMVVWSLGSPGNQAAWNFSTDFAVLSTNPSVSTTVGLSRTGLESGARLTGSEGHGTIQFTGDFSSISWLVTSPEYYAVWNIGVTSAEPPGTNTCEVPALSTSGTATVAGTTVTATSVNATASAGVYRFDNSSNSATFTFNPPIQVFRVTTSSLTGLLTVSATNSATPALSPPAVINQNGTFDFLRGPSASLSASTTISELRLDFSGGGSGDVMLYVNCPTLTASESAVVGLVGTAITNVGFTRTGFGGSVTHTYTGNLPPGLLFNASTGAITGTPTAGGTYTMTITATGGRWGTAITTVTFTITDPNPPAAPPAFIPPLAIIAAPTPTTAPPTTTTPPTTTAPPTTASPTPVRNDTGELPQAQPGIGAATENGAVVPVETFVDNGSDFVLRGADFELRLGGNCTVGCTIATTPEGREVMTLEENGLANVSGFGFLPGTPVYLWLFSEPRFLGELTVAADGTFIGQVSLSGVEIGEHTLQVNGTSFDGLPRSANLGVLVNPAPTLSPVSPGVLPTTGANTNSQLPWVLVLLATGMLLVTMSRRRSAS